MYAIRSYYVELADPGLSQAEDRADLLHRQLFVVVEGDQLLLPLGEDVDRFSEDLFQLPEQLLLARLVAGRFSQNSYNFV